MLYGKSSRQTPFSPQAVCLPLYGVASHCLAKTRNVDEKSLAGAYMFHRGTPLILTGTAPDKKLEYWWSLGRKRLDIIRKLRDAGVSLVTTPNFSLFTQVPRWDNMHSTKRIAITHEEFLREGIPAALHLNARTERDYEHWRQYILSRDEVRHVAFEFGTGAGRGERASWHAERLNELAKCVGRPLHLIVRAASHSTLRTLVSSFGSVTVIETNSYMKTVKRRRAVRAPKGAIRWDVVPTRMGAPLDMLLVHNSSMVRWSFDDIFCAQRSMGVA